MYATRSSALFSAGQRSNLRAQVADPLSADFSNTTDNDGMPPRMRPARVVAEVISGPHKGQRFEFDRHETLLVGRSTKAQLCLNQDPHFSRNHFCLEVNPPQCYFRDLGSRSGTFVNRERMAERHLNDGDVLSGGKTQIRITILPADQPASHNDTTFIPHTGLQSSPPRMPLHRFQPVPGYEVIDEVGSGGMGVVYRAVQKSTGKHVALKVIMPAHSVTEDALQLFVREANILSQLDHPQIVKFYEFGMAAGQLFLAMEYVERVVLKELLQDQSAESRIRVPCAVACQILDALSYSHSRSLIHRDIKPSNILLTRVKRKLRVKVADFGLAKNYVNAGFSAMTLEGDIRGTLAYCAPEQIIDSRYAKPACDIYSVGATLYEYLAGKQMYEFTAERSQLRTVLESDPVPIQQRAPHIPQPVAEAVHRALAKDPADRFATADEMRQTLLPFSKRAIRGE